MSEFRIAKLEALLARVLERKGQPRAVVGVAEIPVAAAVTAVPVESVHPAPVTQVARAESVRPEPVRPVSVQPAPLHQAATTPPPPPVAVPAVSIPRQPVPPTVADASPPTPRPGDDFESTQISRPSGPALVPAAAQSHARISTAPRSEELDARSNELEELPDDESAPVSSERTVDPSVEADTDSAKAPPESTRQLATNPPPQTVPPRISAAPPSLAPESAPRSVANPVITRGSLPPDANDAVEYRGELPVARAPSVGDLLDATLML